MAILEKEVIVHITNRNITYFKSKGYDAEKGIDLIVRVEDLKENSPVRVTKICDEVDCGKLIINQPYYAIQKKRENGKDRCHECGTKKSGMTRKNNIKYEKSFEFWAIANNKQYLLGCFDTVKNKKLPRELSNSTSDKYWFNCPDCGHSVKKMISNVKRRGLSCNFCSDFISFPEKFMISFLKQLELHFETQKIFNWSKNIKHKNSKLCGNKIYDFYVDGMIIETHGEQHYKERFIGISNKAKTLLEEQLNDSLKKSLALGSGEITHYITIDCSESNMEFIKKNILGSKLSEIFDLSKIDWQKCNLYATSNFIKIASCHWNEGIKSTLQIATLMNLSRTTITRYLKQGAELGWCDYNPEIEMKKSGKLCSSRNKKETIQLSLNGDFIKKWESATQASSELNIGRSHINSVCRGNAKSAGGFRWVSLTNYTQL